jgi:hypothetical protein
MLIVGELINSILFEKDRFEKLSPVVAGPGSRETFSGVGHNRVS